MSWLSDLTDAIGLTGGKKTNENGDQEGTSIWPSAIGAATQLAGTYFSLANNKEINDANIKQRQAEMEAALAAKGGGGGGGGSALAAAKLGALSNLYQNWGQLHSRAAQTQSNALLNTGRMGQDPLIARVSVLR